MNSKIFFIAEAIISILFGLPLLFIPELYLSSYMLEGDSLGQVGTAVTRAYGGLLCGVGIIAWLNRSATGQTRKSLIIGCLIVGVTATISYTLPCINGDATSLAWSTVAVCVFLTIWALILLTKTEQHST